MKYFGHHNMVEGGRYPIGVHWGRVICHEFDEYYLCLNLILQRRFKIRLHLLGFVAASVKNGVRSNFHKFYGCFP